MFLRTFSSWLGSLLLLATSAAAQTHADTSTVVVLALAQFAKNRSVYLDRHQALPDDVHRRGAMFARVWLDSIAQRSGVTGVCDSMTCVPLRPREFVMVRLGLPVFTARDTARVFVVKTVGWGGAGCRSEDRIAYHLVVVRDAERWGVRRTEPGDQAFVAESLCFTRSSPHRG